MNSELLEKNYLVIKNFITPEYADNLANKFKEFSKNLSSTGDNLVSGAPYKYNFPPFLKLLFDKVRHVESILEEKIFPTYCYSRIYKEGTFFVSHVDRPQCEVSITLNLSQDKPWLFFIKNPANETVSIDLAPGNAIMYLGQKAPHWRAPYEGKEYTQVFLHYVLQNGNNNIGIYELIEFFKMNFDFSGKTVYRSTTGKA